MGKSKLPAPVQSDETPTMLADGVWLEAELNRDDLLAIFNSSVEETIQQEIAECTTNIQYREKQYDSAAEKLDQLVVSAAESQAVAVAPQFIKAMASLGHKVEVQAEPPTAMPTSTTKQLTGHVKLVQRGLRGDVVCAIPFTVKITASMRKQITAKSKIRTEIEKIKDEQLLWKRKLAARDQLERKARGELAKLHLQRTKTGKEILQVLTHDIRGKIKRLSVS